MNGELVPVNGKSLSYGFPDPVVQRALLFCMESKSVARAHRRLKAELEGWGTVAPDYHTVWEWAKAHEECYQAVTGDRKREMLALSSDVASTYASRMLDAAPNLHDSQIPVAYGIAMQRRTDWDKVGQAGAVAAVQINISAGGKKVEDWEAG